MAQAQWQVLIDWNDDGDFSDRNEDVTAAVLGLTLEHFRDLAAGHIEAARLELELKNDDHKYSPPNGSSPLFGDLKPGRRVWVRAAYPYDALSDAAATRLADHIPTYDSGFSWEEHAGGYRIAPGGTGARTDGVRGSGDCVATIDFADSDVSLGCDFARGSDTTRHGGLCFRYGDRDNYLYTRVTGTAIEIRKVEAGADSLVATAPYAWDVDARKLLQVVLHGASVRVFVDDAEVVDATSSFNRAATRHGLFCDDQADHTWHGFGGWVSLFHGAVDSIHPRPRPEAQYCYVRALDEMERLTSVTLYTYCDRQLPQTTDDVLNDILDYADVSPARRRLDEGMQVVPELWSPPMWGVQATGEIHRLEEEEDGFVYVDGHGHWRLDNRAHRSSAPHTSAAAVLKDADDGSNPYLSELVWDDGVNNVENVVFMRMKQATNHGAQTVWTLTEKPWFSANETKDFLAESRTYDVVVSQRRPRANTDYKANTLQDGSGDDISRQLRVTHPSTADYSGKGTLIRVRSGATAGYLTLLQLRTLNALTFDDPVLVVAEDAASKSTYGQRAKSIDARWTRELEVARTTIDNRLARRKDPRTVLAVTVPNGSKANLMLMLHRRFSDRVTVSYPDMGIDGDFFIEGHRIEVARGWTHVTRELLLQGV